MPLPYYTTALDPPLCSDYILLHRPVFSGRHSREMLIKLSAPLFEPNTLSEIVGKRLFRMAATKQYDHLTCQGTNT